MPKKSEGLAKFMDLREVRGKTLVVLDGLTGTTLILYEGTPKTAKAFRKVCAEILDSVAVLTKAGREA